MPTEWEIEEAMYDWLRAVTPKEDEEEVKKMYGVVSEEEVAGYDTNYEDEDDDYSHPCDSEGEFRGGY